LFAAPGHRERVSDRCPMSEDDKKHHMATIDIMTDITHILIIFYT